jgi:hypothetical protein
VQTAETPSLRCLLRGLSSVEWEEAYSGLACRVDVVEEGVGVGEKRRVQGSAETRRRRRAEDGRQGQRDADGLQGRDERLPGSDVAQAVQ